MPAPYEVIVIGSGAGGGVVASRLAELGRRVLLIERGGYHTAGEFNRWELGAKRMLWDPLRFARTGPDDARSISMATGRSVGGTTNINTKVAVRAVAQDFRKWFAASGLVNDDADPISGSDMDPWYRRVEKRMVVRVRNDWTDGLKPVERGYRALGHELIPVTSYTNYDCERCGSCTTGCPTNSGSTTLNRYIQPALVRTELELMPDTLVTGIHTSALGDRRREVTGVEIVRPDGTTQRLEAPVVVLAAGSLVTPQLLQMSGLDTLGSPSSAEVGRNLGTHTGRIIYGIFDEIIDAHVAYPITAHCEDFADDDRGGFVTEAITVLNPIELAGDLVDDDFKGLVGPELVDVMNQYRHLAGILMMTNDSNGGVVKATRDQRGSIAVSQTPTDIERLENASRFCESVPRASSARAIVGSRYYTSHMQGSVRMGSDPSRSACNADQEMWDVAGLYIGDSSVMPRTLTYNPSLTIMALAERLASRINSHSARLGEPVS